MKHTFTLYEIDNIAQVLLSTAKSKVLCFYGSMGAGKTTLIKALVQQLGSIDVASSPTFSLVQEYHNAQGNVLAYHFDFYRLHEEQEALDLGFDEYLHSNAWILIEWPQNIATLLPQQAVAVHLDFVDESTRLIHLSTD